MTDLGPRRQLGLLWGAVAVLLLALAPLGERLAAAVPACPLKTWTGVPCLSCGTTRSALALAHFDVLGAFAVSPLATVGWMVLVGGGLLAGLAALRGHGVPELPRRLAWPWRLAAVAAVAANWIYLIWHGT